MPGAPNEARLGWPQRLDPFLVSLPFVVDSSGQVVLGAADTAPSGNRQFSFFAQPTSADWVLFLRTPAPPNAEASKVALSGDLSAFPFQDLVAFLGQARWTGALRVFSGNVERTLHITEGEVRAAASTERNERLGEVTVRLGHLTRAQLDSVIDESQPARIGKVLVEKGLLKAHDLYRCLNEHVSEIFHAMMLSEVGTFALVSQPPSEKASVHNLSLSMQGLLMESVRKIDELAQFRRKIPDSDWVVTSKKKPSDGKLDEEESRMLRQVDGRRSVLQLGTANQVSEFEATRLVYRLLEGGYVSIAEPLSTRRKPSDAPESTPSFEQNLIETYSQIFKEIHAEVAREGHLEQFSASASAALRESAVSTSRVLAGLSFEPDGSLSEALVMRQFRQMAREGQLGSEPLASLKQVLSDVMFFLLFQAGELLEAKADEALAKRVKGLLQEVE
jgi:Domain of unknown function (DUF4388)